MMTDSNAIEVQELILNEIQKVNLQSPESISLLTEVQPVTNEMSGNQEVVRLLAEIRDVLKSK